MLILSDWVNRRQQEIIEFQNAQNRALMKKMGPSWNSLTNDQGRLLAPKGKARGRKTLTHLTTIVTPDTIPRWHRRLIASGVEVGRETGEVRCRERLGGMLRHYHREAA
ncbi:MAG: hypothetical protein OSB65_00710 [Roseibacillus sp.]|nr:hypothetical protein [Roseibacillus sp.]